MIESSIERQRPMNRTEVKSQTDERPRRWSGWLFSLGLPLCGLMTVCFACAFVTPVGAQAPQDSGQLQEVPYIFGGETSAGPSASAAAAPRSAQGLGGGPESAPDVGVGGFGTLGRVGYVTGPGFAHHDPFTSFEAAPYILDDSWFLYGDGRLFITNPGRMGGTAGMGARYFVPATNSILGAGFFYDKDGSRRQSFEQWGISLEYLSEWFDLRCNMYRPSGPKQKILSVDFVPGSERFVGQQLVFDTTTTQATAMDGIDLMLTTPIPGSWAQAVNLEVSAGAYHYQAIDTNLPRVWGYKLRVDGDGFNKTVHTYAEYTNDQVYRSKVTVGFDLNYWNGMVPRSRIGNSQYNRMSEWVRRNQQIAVTQKTSLNAPTAAINPVTGQPFKFFFVRNIPAPTPTARPNFPAPAGDGTLLKPYQFITEAQATRTFGRNGRRRIGKQQNG